MMAVLQILWHASGRQKVSEVHRRFIARIYLLRCYSKMHHWTKRMCRYTSTLAVRPVSNPIAASLLSCNLSCFILSDPPLKKAKRAAGDKKPMAGTSRRSRKNEQRPSST